MSWAAVLCPPTLNFVYSPQSIMLMDVGDLLLVWSFFWMGLNMPVVLFVRSTLSNDVELSNEPQLMRLLKLSMALHLLY